MQIGGVNVKDGRLTTVFRSTTLVRSKAGLAVRHLVVVAALVLYPSCIVSADLAKRFTLKSGEGRVLISRMSEAVVCPMIRAD